MVERTTKKRILLVVGTYPPAFGGSGLQVHRLYTRLSARLPIAVTALTQSGRGQPRGKCQFEGVTVHRVSPEASLMSQFLATGRLMLSRGLPSFDLIHASDTPLIGLSACLWARALGIPTIREMTLPGGMPASSEWKGRVVESTYRAATLLFGVNDSVRREYMAMGIPEERIRMNPYPVDTSKYHCPSTEERVAARARYGFRDDDVVHFVLGRIQPRKNQYLAVEALSRLPSQHRLILAGPPGDTRYLNQVRDAVNEHRLVDRVVILPENQRDPVALYHAADIYLVPSVREGGPNVMLEALCCGIPVIANDAIGVRRYVHDGQDGFNVPLEASAFAEAAVSLVPMVRDAEQRRALAERSAAKLGAATLDPEYARHIAGLLRVQP